MKILARVFLKEGRDRPVRGGNPWIFSRAIERTEPAVIEAGTGVEVLDHGGGKIGYGYCNPAMTIAVRMLAFDGAINPDEIVTHRIANAIALRRRIVAGDTNCYRLLNGDGDGLSGVVADRYGDVIVLQLLTAGAERLRGEIVAGFEQLMRPHSIVERSQGAVRRQEGLPDRAGVIAGEPVREAIVTENGIHLAVDFEQGQKTGLFMDQRANRLMLEPLAARSSMLDACCYAGGFALAALRGGADRVVAIDSSERALNAARRNLGLNPALPARIELIRADAAKYMSQSDDRFDVIVLDPPPLARSIRDADGAARLYSDLNAAAIRLLNPGGFLMTFSCSVHFRGEDFVRAVRTAQARAGRNLRTLAHLGAGPDHPVLLGHAEGEYLTGLLLEDLG